MSITNSPPVRFPSGVSTSPRGYAFGGYPFPTPMRLNQYFTDFNTYAAGDYTVTAGSTGTVALVDYNGGAIAITTAATNNDVEAIQLVNKSFEFTKGSGVWFACNVKLTNATNNALMMGLSNDFSALTPTDGVYFSKAAASTTINAVIRAASTSTTIAIGTMADATAYTFWFHYNGAPTPTLYFGSTIPYTTATPSAVPTAFSQPYFSGGNQIIASASSETGATNTLVNIPTTTTLLTAGIALKAGTTVAQVATVDYFLASEEIVARY